MSLSRNEVEQVARLARLALSDEELDALARELSGILAHVEALQAAELGDDAGEAAQAEGAAPLRAEDVEPDGLAAPPETFAPAWVDGFFTVPRLAALDAAGEGEPGA